MQRDQYPLERRLQQLTKKNSAQSLNALAQAIEHSCVQREQRQKRLPIPIFNQPLPIIERRAEIKAAIHDHQVVIICGETGSGKTTQLPKICLELGRGITGLIGHTQPRRIAARSVATQIARELNSDLGQIVGYKVRFHDRISPNTYIKLMTDGILLAETQGDRFLTQYDTLIIDEAHERSLNIDFLLGYLKQLLPKRSDLKVIITSATIDTERFSKHFNQAPILEISGRTYPVEIRYRPLCHQQERDLSQAVLDAVDELSRLGSGDILVFLPGEREIRETTEALRKHHPPHTETLPLYARLSAAEQNKIFKPHLGRRIILATNVAETSLTVPGVHYVVDSGLARLSRYSVRSKVQRLLIEKISQSSANQRSGRCGRIAKGVCIRLYDEEDFLNRPIFTDPEVLRTSLASVILQMKTLKLGMPQNFPFIDPPPIKMINDGLRLLEEIGALDKTQNLTSIGQQLAQLPIDPRIARMVIAGGEFHCLKEILIIASALSIQDPRERPLDNQQAADNAQTLFQNERSDFLSYLKLWENYHHQRTHLSRNKLRIYCRVHFLSYLRLREWQDIHQQLQLLANSLGLRSNQVTAEYEAIHRALLSGLLSNIAFKSEKEIYLGARNIKFQIFPGSTLFKKNPPWIMAAELIETTRLYARCAAKIESEWIEPLAAHLVKRSYFDPHWEKRPAQVMAYEQVTLYGLIITPKRRIHYGPIDPKESREIFIHQALANGHYETQAPFFHHNQQLLQEIETLEYKSRRRDILVDEETLYQFYENLIPPTIYNGVSFEQWRQQAELKSPQLLFLSREDLMRHSAVAVTTEQFPDQLLIKGIPLALSYHFEPNHPLDGLTLTIPIAILNQLEPSRFQWLVPGLLKEKITHLIKALPKTLRRNFIPAPDFAAACTQALHPDQGPLLETLARQLQGMTGVPLSATVWQDTALPPYLLMNFRLIDDAGKELAMGRDLIVLQQEWADRAQRSFQGQSNQDFIRDGITQWDFGPLPDQIELDHHGLKLIGYPGLQDKGNSVSLVMMDSAEVAQEITVLGLRRLFILSLPQTISRLRKNLPNPQGMYLHYARIPPAPWRQDHSFQPTYEHFKEELLQGVIDRVFILDQLPIRSKEAFTARKEKGTGNLLAAANAFCHLIGEILSEYHQICKKLNSNLPLAWLGSINDMRSQLNHLVYLGFINQTPATQLPHFLRYLKAIKLRLSRLEENPSRDQQRQTEIKPLWLNYQQKLETQYKDKEDKTSAALANYRWMLEEYRVSLFAQELGTLYPISAKRLKNQWQEIK
ncbi:ATP-dependent helicase HrpA [Candidatus Nitrosoglobus terrae]|uniref:ATP-dependent helicase HrpA n=2 Tax=Candidatus Nitrosoglobus terrae TaxID=1630141 RepID=A0A1Q2SNK6_9GAMM|nr:ATP-dependent helicase HrpA [Candidatus Nitrosoglobus terrae]